MNNRFIFGISLLTLLFAGGAFFLFNTRPQVTNYPSQGSDIVAFGDSLIVGAGGKEKGGFISLLSQKIGQPIANLGRSGDTSSQGLSRIDALDRYKPKVVILLLGGNDRLRDVPSSTTFANLAKIIEEVHERGGIVLLLGIRGSIVNDQYKDKFEKLRNDYKTAYVPDVLKDIFGDSRYMADVVHPNDAGYAYIAERIYPVLIKLLD